MFSALLQSKSGFEETVKRLEREGLEAIVVKPEFAAAPRLLQYSYFLAFKRLQTGAASARKLGVEWMARLAGTNQLQAALAFCKPAGELVCVASPVSIPAKLLAGLGTPKKMTVKQRREFEGGLRQLYRVPVEINVGLEDFLVERAAVTALD